MTLKVDNKEFLSEWPDLETTNVDSERPTVRDKDQVELFRQRSEERRVGKECA